VCEIALQLVIALSIARNFADIALLVQSVLSASFHPFGRFHLQAGTCGFTAAPDFGDASQIKKRKQSLEKKEFAQSVRRWRTHNHGVMLSLRCIPMIVG
jgi:hypothetical protein